MSFSVKPIFPTVSAEAMPVSFQMLDASHSLATQIECGEFDELMPHQRTELRELANTIGIWSEHLGNIEVEKLPRHRQPRPATSITRLLRLFGRG